MDASEPKCDVQRNEIFFPYRGVQWKLWERGGEYLYETFLFAEVNGFECKVLFATVNMDSKGFVIEVVKKGDESEEESRRATKYGIYEALDHCLDEVKGWK